MPRICGQLLVRRDPETVFDAVLDEPTWNPSMTSAVWLTPPPTAPGSRLRVVMGGRMDMHVEYTDVDRPRRLASRTRSSLMTTEGVVSVVPHPDGSTLSWDWEYHLRGPARVLTPLFAPFAGWWERRNWTRLRDYVEQPARPA